MRPTVSWPRITGRLIFSSPFQRCTSVPQIPAISVRTRAAPGSSAGSSNSFTTRSELNLSRTHACAAAMRNSAPRRARGQFELLSVPDFRLYRMPKNYWIVKQEPEAYSWDTFVKEGSTSWTGVRNFVARNNLRAMKKGDLVFFYHSVSEKQIVGLAKVSREHYPDKTAEEGDWSAVDLVPVKPLASPVSLATIKA